MHSFGGGGKGEGGKWINDAYKRAIARLPEYCARLKTVIIENLDAIDCVEKYDAPDTLFYLDPPYICTSKHGDHARAYGGLNVDNERMVKTLLNLKGRFVLSCYDAAVYKPLEEVAERLQFKAFTSICMTAEMFKTGKSKRVEIVYASNTKKLF